MSPDQAQAQVGMTTLPRADFLRVPVRSEKPRETGLTVVIDNGVSLRTIEDLVETAADFVDFVKFGWCTGALIPTLDRKIEVLRSCGIGYWFGGTMFEAAYAQDKLDDYSRWLDSKGASHIEISDGTLEIAQDEKLSIIARMKQRFTVVSEVGSKDAETVMPPSRWVALITGELKAGSWKVITEGRESGTAGIFRSTGEIREGLIEDIVASGLQLDRLIFEAPNKQQQVWLLRHLGHQVSFGNIAPADAIGLETLRLGLRSDTMKQFGGVR